jgi:hypothetical protein
VYIIIENPVEVFISFPCLRFRDVFIIVDDDVGHVVALLNLLPVGYILALVASVRLPKTLAVLESLVLFWSHQSPFTCFRFRMHRYQAKIRELPECPHLAVIPYSVNQNNGVIPLHKMIALIIVFDFLEAALY